MVQVETSSVPARLRLAREASGFKTARVAADSIGTNYRTYTQHENGRRGFDYSTAQRYGEVYGVYASWILEGKGRGPFDDESFHADSVNSDSESSNDLLAISESELYERLRGVLYVLSKKLDLPVDSSKFASITSNLVVYLHKNDGLDGKYASVVIDYALDNLRNER